MSTAKRFNSLMFAIAYAYQNPGETAVSARPPFDIEVTYDFDAFIFCYKSQNRNDTRPLATISVDNGANVCFFTPDQNTSPFDFNVLIERVTISTVNFCFFKAQRIVSIAQERQALSSIRSLLAETLEFADTFPETTMHFICGNEPYSMMRTDESITFAANDEVIAKFDYDGSNSTFTIVNSTLKPDIVNALYDAFTLYSQTLR